MTTKNYSVCKFLKDQILGKNLPPTAQIPGKERFKLIMTLMFFEGRLTDRQFELIMSNKLVSPEAGDVVGNEIIQDGQYYEDNLLELKNKYKEEGKDATDDSTSHS